MKLLRNYFIALGGILFLWITLLALWVGGVINPTAEIYGICFPNREDSGTVYTDSDLTEAWAYALSTAEPVETPTERQGTEIRIHTLNGRGELRGEYSLHVISMMDREGILEDLREGTFYRLSANGMTRLLSNSVFDCEEQNLIPPLPLTLTALESEESLKAFPAKESLFLAEGGICENASENASGNVSENVTEEPHVFVVIEGQGVQITPAVFPDAWTVMVRQEKSILFAQSRITGNSLPFMTQAGEYTYVVTAHWDLSPLRDWYGEVTYEIPVRIQSVQGENSSSQEPVHQ